VLPTTEAPDQTIPLFVLKTSRTEYNFASQLYTTDCPLSLKSIFEITISKYLSYNPISVPESVPPLYCSGLIMLPLASYPKNLIPKI
jgi:hypothetical protein